MLSRRKSNSSRWVELLTMPDRPRPECLAIWARFLAGTDSMKVGSRIQKTSAITYRCHKLIDWWHGAWWNNSRFLRGAARDKRSAQSIQKAVKFESDNGEI